MNTTFTRIIRIIALAIAAFALIFIFCLTLRSTGFFTIVLGSSMDPTLHSGQIMTGLPVHWNPMQQVNHGDIVTLSTHSGKTIIKRVIALPGDTLEIRDCQVYLNDAPLQEDYIAEPMRTRDLGTITLGEDEYFVLGDNRNISADSRYYGLFSRSDIISVVQPRLTVLPLLVVVALIALVTAIINKLYDEIAYLFSHPAR